MAHSLIILQGSALHNAPASLRDYMAILRQRLVSRVALSITTATRIATSVLSLLPVRLATTLIAHLNCVFRFALPIRVHLAIQCLVSACKSVQKEPTPTAHHVSALLLVILLGNFIAILQPKPA